MTTTLTPEQIQALDDLQPGDIVEHPKWGIGSIIQRSGQGEYTKLIVAFPEADGNGQKKLLACVAKLKKIEDKPVSPEPEESTADSDEKKPKDANGEEEEDDDDDDDDDTLLPVQVDDDDDEDEEISKSAKNAKKDDDWENETED